MLNLKKVPKEVHKPHKLFSSVDNQLASQSFRPALVQGFTDSSLHAIVNKPPAIAPKPVQPDHVLEAGKKQLLNMIQNLPEGALRTKLESKRVLIELAEIQDRQRKEVMSIDWQDSRPSEGLSHDMLERGLIDRGCYIRLATINHARNKQETKAADKMEQSIKAGQENKKRSKHTEIVNEVMNEHRDFFEFHRKKYVRNIQAALKKCAYSIKAHIDMRDRQELARREKYEKERLKALKANDIDAYIDLINTTKNNRLLEIIQQTDKFLRQLGAKVKIQKGDEHLNEENLQSEEEDSRQIAESFKVSSKMYYNITHTIHEQVKHQPEGVNGGVLKNYQLIGLEWLVSLYNNNLHGILADEMGLGKTIQTISLFQYLIERKGNYGPFLVVVPLSTLSNWMLELMKWAPKIRAVVYKGPPVHRKVLLSNVLSAGSYNVLVTTYEYIIKDKLQLSKIHWSYIVVDEGHRMKNSKSKFAQILGLQFQSDHRLLLTGTPLQNNLAELWSLLNFLLPKIFHSLDDFEKWFNQPFSKLPGEKQIELNEEENLLIINRLHQVLRPFLLRRVKKEVESELPDKVEFVMKVELSAWQKKLYKEIQEKGNLGRDPITGKVFNINNSVMQLRKVCNHPYLFLNYESMSPITDEIWRCSGKFELLDRILPKLIASNHKVLIFSQMTQLMDILQIYFNFRGFNHLRLDGTTKAEERDRRRDLFNSPNSEYHIFLLSTRAGGLGLNLQTADTVIIYDSDWNPQMDLQAQDRAHRIGQTNEVRVYRLVTNTKVEETILTKAAYKKDVDAKVIQAGLFNNKSTDIERREKLKNLLKNEDEEEAEFENEFLTDEQINEIIARNDEEFELFSSMDRQIIESAHYGKSRLLTDEQLPSWLTTKEEENSDREYGRGYRGRKPSYYTQPHAKYPKPVEVKEGPEELPVKRSLDNCASAMPYKQIKLESRDLHDNSQEVVQSDLSIKIRKRSLESEDLDDDISSVFKDDYQDLLGFDDE
jgi:ATP-dependent helicase STH1/SNF2